MKSIFAIMCISFITTSCALTNNEEHYIIDKDAFCDFSQTHQICRDKEGKELSGRFIKYQDDGIYDEINIKNGKLNGPLKEYYSEGQVRREYFFKNGELDGPAKGYYSDGHIYAESFYKDGKLEGSFKNYDRDGNIRQEETYKNGELHGIKKDPFYGSGCGKACMWVTPYKYGEKNGMAKECSETDLLKEYPYEDGKLNGIGKTYDYGTTACTDLYIDGRHIYTECPDD